MNPDELEREMKRVLAEGGDGPLLSGTIFKLHFEVQKPPNWIIRYLKTLPPPFLDNLVMAGKKFAEAPSIQASKQLMATFSSMHELVSVKDMDMKKCLLKVGSAIFALRSRDQKNLDRLVRGFDKTGFAEILMAVVEQFYPADYQPLVEFINTMPAKPVVEEGDCAAAHVSAENQFDKTLLSIEGLPSSCKRESFGLIPGLVHADYNKGDSSGFLRFETSGKAEEAFAIASELSFVIDGVHPTVRLLTTPECVAYREKVEAFKLQRKEVGRSRKH
jgi:hypothetical protein